MSYMKTELVLPNVKMNDTGWYMCSLRNYFGTKRSFAFISVRQTLDDPPPPSDMGMTWAVLGTTISIMSLICFTVCVISCKKYRKSERDKQKAIENAQKVAYWTKKIMIGEISKDQLHPRITIEKVRTETRGVLSDTQPHSEYEFPEDPDWEFPRHLLTLQQVLGEGAFGRVKLAIAKGVIVNGSLVPDESVATTNQTKVAVKMLKEGHTDSDVTDLYSELEIMKRIGSHMNIINLLGECSQPPGSPLLVMVEYARYGNLRQFLRDRKSGARLKSIQERKARQAHQEEMIESDCLQLQNSGSDMSECYDEYQAVSLKMMLSFALQVSRGMEFLSSRRCVHRDLAARNILVSDNLVLKIADFGMARDLQDSEYYRKESDGRLPIKWMSPESLFSRISTTMSDVWSFGILFWEIVTFGDNPYKTEMSPKVFMELIKGGYKMQQPLGCPDSVYAVMRKCWEYQPEDRPGWSELVADLYDLHTTTDPDKYLDLCVPGLETPPSSAGSSYDQDKSYITTQQTNVGHFATNQIYDQTDNDAARPLLYYHQPSNTSVQHVHIIPPDQTRYIQVYSGENSDQNFEIEGSNYNDYSQNTGHTTFNVVNSDQNEAFTNTISSRPPPAQHHQALKMTANPPVAQYQALSMTTSHPVVQPEDLKSTTTPVTQYQDLTMTTNPAVVQTEALRMTATPPVPNLLQLRKSSITDTPISLPRSPKGYAEDFDVNVLSKRYSNTPDKNCFMLVDAPETNNDVQAVQSRGLMNYDHLLYQQNNVLHAPSMMTHTPSMSIHTPHMIPDNGPDVQYTTLQNRGVTTHHISLDKHFSTDSGYDTKRESSEIEFEQQKNESF